MVKHLLVNAYPRSGSIFFANFIIEHRPEILSINSLHVPYILDNPNILSVSIIRNPKEAISSYLYMNFHNEKQIIGTNNKEFISDFKKHIASYDIYLDYYEKLIGVDFLHVVDFDSMKDNPHKEALSLFDKFKIDYKKDKVANLKEVEKRILDDNFVEDRNGHLPRIKTKQRILIDDFVSNSADIQDIFNRYKNVKKMI